MHVILGSILLIFAQTIIFACSCLPNKNPLAEMAESDAVFLAVPEQIKLVTTETSSQTGLQLRTSYISVQFRILKSWKGADKEYVNVQTDLSGRGRCGYPFLAGEQYLVYAKGNKELIASRCSRRALAKDAQTDIKELGVAKYEFNVHDK
jgi:hypothetical protein